MTIITLGDLLRRHRLEAGMNQKELASELDYHHSHISRVERDERMPSLDYLKRFIQVLQLPKEDSEEIMQVFNGGEITSDLIVPARDRREKNRLKTRDEYLEWMKRDHAEMNVKGLRTYSVLFTLSMPWDKGFVPLKIKEKGQQNQDRPPEDLPLAQKGALSERQWLEDRRRLEQYLEQVGTEQTDKLLTIADVLAAKQFVIEGNLGAGKTTMLQHIMYAIASEEYTHIGTEMRGKTPILVEIGKYAKALEEKHNLSLTSYIRREDYGEYGGYGPFLYDEIQRQSCVVLLDGLDEVMKVDLRRAITDNIDALANQYPHNYYVVTSRPEAHQDTPLSSNFHRGSISELEENDIERLATEWYQKLKDTGFAINEEDAPKKFMAALRSQPEAMELASIPLHLIAFLLNHYQKYPFPSRRIDIYRCLTETRLETWPSLTRDINKWLQPEIKARLEGILASIAFKLRRTSSNDQATQSLLLEWMEKLLIEKCGYTQETADASKQELLTIISQQLEMLRLHEVMKGQSVYEFPHRCYTDYLASFEMQEQWKRHKRNAKEANEGPFFSQYVHRERWQEIIRLMVARAGPSIEDGNQRIEEIINLDDTYESVLHRNLLLAGACLGDNVAIEWSVAEDIIYKLTQLLKDDIYTIRWKARDVLSRLKKTQYQAIAVENLEQIINNETEIQVKWVAALTLINLDKYETVRQFLYHLVEYPAGDYSVWALNYVLHKEPQEEKIELLKRLIQRQDCDMALDLQAVAKVENTFGEYIGDNYRLLLWRLVGEENLKELAITARKKACSPKRKEQGDWILWQLSKDQSLETIKQLATNARDEYMRCQAAKKLDELGYHEDAVQHLEEVAKKEPINAAQALHQIGELGKAINILRKVVWHPESKIRDAAIEKLAAFQVSEQVIPIVLEFYLGNTIENEKSQWRIIRALAKVYPGELTAELWMDIALQEEHDYRYEAAEALLETNKKAAIATLKGILRRKSEVDRKEVVEKLIELGEDLEALNETLKEIENQLCTPYKKYWINQSLADLELLIEGNGASQTRPNKKSTKATLKKHSNRQRLYQVALVELDTLIKKDPNNVDALLAKARILKEQGQDEKAFLTLDQAIKLASPNDWVCLHAAKMYKDWDEESLAIKALVQIRDSTNDPYICIEVADMLAEWVEKDEALSTLEQAKYIGLPNEYEVWENIGVVLHKCHRTDEAINAVNQQISLLEDDKIDWLEIAEKFYKLEDNNQAQATLEKAKAHDPKNAKIQIRVAKLLKKWGEEEEAKKTINQAEELNSKDPNNWIEIADILHSCGETKRAVKALEKAADLGPEWVEIWRYKAQTLQKIDHYEEAAIAYQKAIKLESNYAGSWRDIGDIYRVLGHYEQALASHKKAVELNPENDSYWNSLGITYRYIEQYKEAVVAYQKGLELSPNDARLYNNLGYLYLVLEKWNEAEKALIKAYEQNEHNYTLLANLGILRCRQGDIKESQRLFNEALSICKDNDLHARLNRAWLQVVTEKTAAEISKLQAILTEIPPPGLLAAFIQDTDLLVATEEAPTALFQMRQLMIDAKTAWKPKLITPDHPK